MRRSIIPVLSAVAAFALPIEAQTPEKGQAVPPFVALTVALVDEDQGGGDRGIIVWGPHENGSDHVILLPAGRANPALLSEAVVTLVTLVKNGSAFEPGTRLRGEGATQGSAEVLAGCNGCRGRSVT